MQLGKVSGSDPGAAQRILQNRFLLQQVGLRYEQVLFAGEQLRLRPGDLDFRQGADSDLRLIIFEQLLRRRKLFLPGLHILIEAHQIPIEVQHRRNRGDHLLLKLQIGDFDVVSLHPDIAAVYGGAEAVQQVLRNLEVDVAVGVRVEAEQIAVHRCMSAGESERRAHAKGEVLRILQLKSPHPFNQSVRAGKSRVAFRNRKVLEIHVSEDRRIERRNRRPELCQYRGADAAARGAGWRAVGIDGDAGKAHACGTGGNTQSDASQQTTALCAPQDLPGQQRAIALHFDVDVVFHRQRDNVLGRQVKVPRFDQGIDTGCVGQINGRDGPDLIRMCEPSETSGGRVDSDGTLSACRNAKNDD